MQRRASAHTDQRKHRYEQHREQGNERRRRVDVSGPPDMAVMAGDLQGSATRERLDESRQHDAAYMTAGNAQVERSPRWAAPVHAAERRKYNANTR